MQVGERLKAARLAAGFQNASAFGRHVELAPNTIYRLEKGDEQPSIETLSKWARGCGVTSDSLLGLHCGCSVPVGHKRTVTGAIGAGETR